MRNLIQTWAMKVTIALALLLFSPLGAWAQQITVKGIVKDEMVNIPIAKAVKKDKPIADELIAVLNTLSN